MTILKVNSVVVKQCTLCKSIKSLDKFAFQSKIIGNYRKSRCRVCDNKRRSKHQKDNRLYYNIKQKEWRDCNIERSRETCGKAANRHYVRTRQNTLEAVSGNNIKDIKCVQCGFDDIRALQIDHIDGGGGKQFKERISTTRYYKDMLANPEKYQILCANCNWVKRYTNSERCSKYGQD